MTYQKTLKMMLCATALTGFTLGAAFAEDKSGENVQANASDVASGAVSQVALAQDLFEHAQGKKNAIAALAAAQIMMSVDMKDVEREKTTEGAGEEGDEGASSSPVDAAAMLAAAKDYAGGDASVMGLIEDAEAKSSRGRIGGASRTLSRLPAGRTDVFRVPFYGGSFAEIAIVGDGDTNLDLVVTDENGNVICLDRSYSDKLYCSFTPRWDGYFLVGVKNQGRIRNSYYILTN